MDGQAYFCKAFSYECKMFMKPTTGVNVTKAFCPCHPCSQ
jgi:hypothetical protein